MAAHDFAEHFDVWRAIASKDVGDIPEVVRAQQTWTDDCEKTGVSVAAISESVDHVARYEECLARVQVGVPAAHGKRSDAFQPEDGFIEVVVAVRRGHACIGGDVALEDAHTASGVVCVDMKTDCQSPDLDRLGRGVRHGCSAPWLRPCWRTPSVNDKEALARCPPPAPVIGNVPEPAASDSPPLEVRRR